MPYAALCERTIPVSRATTFGALTDFGGLDKYLPGAFDSIKLEGRGVGSIRTIMLAEATGFPGKVVERCEAMVDESVYSYSIIGKSCIPFDNYVAVVCLEDARDGGCVVRYGSNWTPDGMSAEELKAFLETLYGNICDGIVNVHG